jgi:hypothetical protein
MVEPAVAVAPVLPIIPPVVPAVKKGTYAENASIDDEEVKNKYAKPIRAWAQDW